MPRPMVKAHVSIAQGLGDWHARSEEDANPLAPTSEEMGLRCPKCSHWGLSGFDFCGEFIPVVCRECSFRVGEYPERNDY